MDDKVAAAERLYYQIPTDENLIALNHLRTRAGLEPWIYEVCGNCANTRLAGPSCSFCQGSTFCVDCAAPDCLKNHYVCDECRGQCSGCGWPTGCPECETNTCGFCQGQYCDDCYGDPASDGCDRCFQNAAQRNPTSEPARDPLAIPQELTPETLEMWSDAVKEHLDLWIFHLYLYNDGDICLSSIIVKRDALKRGKGTTAMEMLTDLADHHQRKIWLTPGEKDKYHGTTSRSRLIKFYRRFGFILNKGRNKDYRKMESMYRRPLEGTRKNPTGPLISSDAIALMTKEEFIDSQNPDGKWHSSESYDFDLESLNRNYNLKHLEDHQGIHGGIFRIHSSDDNYLIQYSDDRRGPFRLVAVIYQGVLYYKHPSFLHRLPKGYRKDVDVEIKRWETTWIPFEIASKRRVKYLQDYIELIADTKNKNLKKYPHLIQNIRLDGEPYQIRSSQSLALDHGISIVILNDRGDVVAQASDEWGATLLVVAQEYRKRGLGEILGKLWGQWNPGYTSGGFTSKGRAAAEAIWEAHVREVRAKGGYSDLLKKGLITKGKIKEIFSGLTRPAKPKSLPDKTNKGTSRKIQILIEKDKDEQGEYWGPMFIIYDEAYLDTLDDDYIYGFGFFRDSEHVGDFLFTIDYDTGFRKLSTYIALQIAKNNGERIYVGAGYGDLLEFEDLDHVKREGDYVYLTEDVTDLEPFRLVELRNRLNKDSYNQKYHQLIEAAHAKWD